MKFKIFIPLFLLAFTAGAQAAEVEKILHHRFDRASAAGTMNVESIYGNVNIQQWDNNYAEVTVNVKANARRQEDAQRLLDAIRVNFTENGASGFAKTVISSRNSNGRNENFEIVYHVNIPRGMNIDVSNKYGNVRAGDLDGTLTAELKYGNINTGNLGSGSNSIEIKYGNANIGNAPELKLDMGYGNFSGKNITVFDVDSKYSNLKADYTGTLSIGHSSYDKYEIGEAVAIRANSGSSDMKIGTLHKSIVLPGVKYGNINIDRVEAGFETVDISASYSNVNLKFVSPGFGYELYARYGRISLSGIQADTRIQKNDHTYTEMIGTAGDYSGNSRIVKINVSYGNVELKGY